VDMYASRQFLDFLTAIFLRKFYSAVFLLEIRSVEKTNKANY